MLDATASVRIGLAGVDQDADLSVLAGRLQTILHNLEHEGADLLAESYF